MKEIKLKQLVYVSNHAIHFSDDDLSQLMKKARTKNKRLNITGLLLSDNQHFLQVIEGPEISINELISDILADERHNKIDIIFNNENIFEREFSRWSMGYKILGKDLPDDYKALDNRLKDILSVAKPNGDLAHQLLIEFRNLKKSFLDI